MSIALCCWTVVSLAVFFGIFFGINYPEIKSSEYIPTICQYLSTTLVTRFCCKLDVCYCSGTTPEFSLPLCGQLVSQSQSLSPVACSENSVLCPESGLNAYCDNGCCTSKTNVYRDRGAKKRSCTERQRCNMICNQCYDVELNLEYYVGQHKQNLIYKTSFSKLHDANVFLSSHKQNSAFLCFYNPSSVTDIIFDRHFTRWKWILFAFPAFSLFLCLVILTNLILFHCVENKTWRWSIVSTIWIGIIIPFAILLQVWKYGLVSKIGLIILMVLILIFVAFGSLPIVIKLLIFCGFSLLQAIGLSFIGLIMPVVYVWTILYVPSSKKILFPILGIQLILVILIVLAKFFKLTLKREDLIKHIMYL